MKIQQTDKGKHFVAVCDALELKGRTIARALEIHESSVAQWKMRGVGAFTVKRFCETFGVSQKFLETGEGDMFSPTSTPTFDKPSIKAGECNILRAYFSSLTPEQRTIARSVLNRLLYNDKD